MQTYTIYMEEILDEDGRVDTPAGWYVGHVGINKFLYGRGGEIVVRH